MIEAFCGNCHKKYLANNAWIKRNKHHFCSRECSGIYRSNNLIGRKNPNYRNAIKKEICLFCKNEFEYFQSQRKFRKTIFCSRKCTDLYKREHFKPPHTGKTKEEIPWLKRISIKFSNDGNPMFGRIGNKHPHWKGGKSLEEYPSSFSTILKREIRIEYNNKCFICFIDGESLNQKLHIHHIDYNKHNSSKTNLVPLCHYCHMVTNYNRSFWESKLKEKLLCHN